LKDFLCSKFTTYFQKSDNLPRLHWCPTGPFAFLPIHAAGIFFEGVEEECISEYVVSSYTPTISALLSSSTISTNSFKMLAVIQPDTPGQRPLPCTIHEMHQIEAHVPSKDLVKLVCGSVEEVLSHLPDVTIVHFACHGQQNTQNPFDSALLLQNGQLKVSQIMQQSMPNASLAFLSACETAMGHENLPDEAIHLSAGLLFAGFCGVVATMW
jgi:CHAT domain-containing protein